MKKLWWNACGALLIASIAMASFAAPTVQQLEAARDKSLAYLIKQQNGDGSWGKTPAEKVRETSAVLDTFVKYNVKGVVYRRGINWLANAEAVMVDDLARQIYTLNAAKVNTTALCDKLIALGITTTANGTLWGAYDDYRLSMIDSALALKALAAACPGYNVTPAITYIFTLRNTNLATSDIGSGWGFTELRHDKKSDSQVIPTAQMILTLHHLNIKYDEGAAKWLALRMKANGVISDKDLVADVETAVSIQALGYAKKLSLVPPEVNTNYPLALDYLLARQAQTVNGSIDNKIFKTAMAAQAWFNVNQMLSDSDMDGIPDSVETQLGTNSSVADTEYLEKGNGNNFTESTSGSFHFIEMLVNRSTTTQLDARPGTMVIASGSLPPGMTLNSANGTIAGTPTKVGNYSVSYRITMTSGLVYLGAATLRVAAADSDIDEDGIPASYEILYPSALSNLNSNDAILDSDGDGLTNLQEYGINANPTLRDSDGDGLDDFQEFIVHSNPRMADSDLDGMSDYYEFYNGLNLNTNDANTDSDNDGLTNYQEYLKGLPANDTDADNDGILDGADLMPFYNAAVFVAIQYILLN